LLERVSLQYQQKESFASGNEPLAAAFDTPSPSSATESSLETPQEQSYAQGSLLLDSPESPSQQKYPGLGRSPPAAHTTASTSGRLYTVYVPDNDDYIANKQYIETNQPCPPHHLDPRVLAPPHPRVSNLFKKKVPRRSSDFDQENRHPIQQPRKRSGKELALIQCQQEFATMPTGTGKSKSGKAATRAERAKKRDAKKDGNKGKPTKTDTQDGNNVASNDLNLVKQLLAAGNGLGGGVSVLASQEDKIKQLEAKLQAAESKNEAALIMEKSEGMQKEIIKQVKAILYRDTKFVGNDKHLEKLASKCYDTMGYKLEKVPSNHKEVWVAAYKDYVKKGFNEARSYVQQQLQNDFKALLVKENLPVDELVEKCGWITPDLAKKCALRTVDLDDKTEFDAFKWYWTVGLQKELGYNEWGPNKHLYQMPSQATTKR